jgi:CBS domain-containing protein
MSRKIAPDVISGQTLQKFSPRDTARAAAKMIREKRISAVLVIKSEKLFGIITQPDMTALVIAARLNPDMTSCAEIMKANPDMLSPYDTVHDAITMTRKCNYRHLPVALGARVAGIVSVRDFYAVANTGLEQDLKDRNAFNYGKS